MSQMYTILYKIIRSLARRVDLDCAGTSFFVYGCEKKNDISILPWFTLKLHVRQSRLRVSMKRLSVNVLALVFVQIDMYDAW